MSLNQHIRPSNRLHYIHLESPFEYPLHPTNTERAMQWTLTTNELDNDPKNTTYTILCLSQLLVFRDGEAPEEWKLEHNDPSGVQWSQDVLEGDGSSFMGSKKGLTAKQAVKHFDRCHNKLENKDVFKMRRGK